MDFLIEYYIFFLIAGIVVIMALIGYVAEKNEFGKITKKEDEQSNFSNEELLKEVSKKKEKKKKKEKPKKEDKQKKTKKEDENNIENKSEDLGKSEDLKADLESLEKAMPEEKKENSLDEVVNLNVGMADAISKTQQLNLDEINAAKEELENSDKIKEQVQEDNVVKEEEQKPIDEVKDEGENSLDEVVPDDLKAPLDLNKSLESFEKSSTEEKTDKIDLDEAMDKVEEKEKAGFDMEKTVDLSAELGANLNDSVDDDDKKKDELEEFKI